MNDTSNSLKIAGWIEVRPGHFERPRLDIVKPTGEHIPVEKESGLHDDVINFCDHQWPPWLCIRARMDKASTIAVGCQDLTIFASGARVFLIEAKAKYKKPSQDQLIWHKKMEMLGFTVHVIQSMSQFLKIVNTQPTEKI